ncbi:hypothetical protein [Flavobacterium notoginsengisoli]|uniref:hypothetical protein n=1 Tax=Flavobacterium notoginsengisoli TaxID=1478199 RepID=UPI0036D3A737
MEKLADKFTVSLYLYQIAFLLHIILTALTVYYVLKNKDKFRNPYLLIVFSFLFPFIVSVPLVFSLAKKKVIL